MRGWREYRFSVPFVRGKGRPRHMLNGHTYVADDDRRAMSRVADAFREVADDMCPAPAGCPVHVAVMVGKPATARMPMRAYAERDLTPPDVDNVAKLVMDALNGLAYEDDRQVEWLSVERDVRTREAPVRTEVRVWIPVDWEPGDRYMVRDVPLFGGDAS